MAKKESDEKKTKQEGEAQPLPFLLDLSLTLWQVVVVVGGGLAAFLSWYHGASLLIIGLRSGVTILGLGALAIVVNRTLSQGMLDAYYRPSNDQERR